MTPDSFSEHDQQSALAKAAHLIECGVPCLDIGAQSTAPTSPPIDQAVERQRLDSFLAQVTSNKLNFKGKTFSLDSFRFETVEWFYQRLQESGLMGDRFIWNDVSGVLPEGIENWLKRRPDASYVYSHTFNQNREQSSGHWLNTQGEIGGQDLLKLIKENFRGVIGKFRQHGLSNQLILDPAFGFSKNRAQNLYLAHQLFDQLIGPLAEHKRWLLGISRKSFLRDETLKSETPGPVSKADAYWWWAEIQAAFFYRHWVQEAQKNPLLRSHEIAIRLHDPLVWKSLEVFSN